MPRMWRGIQVDEGLSDQLLERLYSIPGIAVYSGAMFPGFTFTIYPWPDRSEIQSLTSELKDAFSDVAIVHSADRRAFPIFSLTPTVELMPAGWWKVVIERLERFASQRPVATPTIEDFEKDILLGASEVFAFKQKSWPHERYVRFPRTVATPSSEEEARHFLETLADLNKASVYDLYLDDLERFRGMDIPLNRWQFGHDAALRGLGLWHGPITPLSIGYQIPVWWSVASGSFDVCVLRQPINRELVMYSILLDHPESGVSTKFELDPRPHSEDFLVHRGCLTGSYFSDELAAWRNYLRGSPSYKLDCKGMPGREIPGYIASFFQSWDRKKVVAAVERVLARCFSKD